CRVAATCTVGYDRNRYSVPAEHAGQGVFLRATATRIKIVQKGKTLACHKRCFGREQQILDPWHYLPVLERKPGALRNGAPFVQWDLPSPVRKVRDHLLKQDKGDRAFASLSMAGSD
ncbi:Mu transposase domain-containing protein, partial [Thiolapillus sp.]